MTSPEDLTVEILKQIRSDLKDGLGDAFAELVRMRTPDNERLSKLEDAVAELQRKVG